MEFTFVELQWFGYEMMTGPGPISKSSIISISISRLKEQRTHSTGYTGRTPTPSLCQFPGYAPDSVITVLAYIAIVQQIERLKTFLIVGY
jgi:hypothetical protein